MATIHYTLITAESCFAHVDPVLSKCHMSLFPTRPTIRSYIEPSPDPPHFRYVAIKIVIPKEGRATITVSSYNPRSEDNLIRNNSSPPKGAEPLNLYHCVKLINKLIGYDYA